MTNPASDKKADAAETKPREPSDNIVVTRHTATIGGQEIAYTATTGTLVLREEAETEGASEGEVWVQREGRLVPVAVTVGTTDATQAAIVAGALTEGTEVVTNILTGGTASTPSTTRVLARR